VRIAAALSETHDAEADLAAHLLEVGERHKVEHDVYHLTRTLRRWCDRHVHLLAEQSLRFDVDLDAEAVSKEKPGGGLLDRLRETTSEIVGGRVETGLLLLRDLRELHLAAARASLAWTVLGQGAQAIREPALLAVVSKCHPQTIRTMKWTVQKIKEASPQILAA
jgi:hypothetical protein